MKWLGLLVAAAVVFASGFAVARVVTAKSSAAGATHELRPSEVAGPLDAVVDGTSEFSVIAWRCGLYEVVGDHAAWVPDGRYCRLRLRLRNIDRPLVEYRAKDQQVVDADGNQYPVDIDAIQISEQPLTLKPMLHSVHEFDVWFDVPTEATIVAARLFASADSDGVTVRLER